MSGRDIVLERLVLRAYENQRILTADPHEVDRIKSTAGHEHSPCDFLYIKSLHEILRIDTGPCLQVLPLLTERLKGLLGVHICLICLNIRLDLLHWKRYCGNRIGRKHPGNLGHSRFGL